MHNYIRDPLSGNYNLVTSSSKAGIRSFTRGQDLNSNFDLNYQGKVRLFFIKGNWKIGSRYQLKSRSFEKRSFSHIYYGEGASSVFVVDSSQFGSSFSPENFLSEDSEGLILVENTDGASRNGYSADEQINAQYVMVDIPMYNPFPNTKKRIILIAGIRREQYTLDLVPYNPVTGQHYINPLMGSGVVHSRLNEVNYLPSLNLIFDLQQNVKLRLSHSRTVARAEFREIAPFEYQEFYSGDVAVGYPYLKTTHIGNNDFRLEWYPSPAEFLSFSIFDKSFENPIEIALIKTSDLTYKTYQNGRRAHTAGIEFELRKRLLRLPMKAGILMILINGTVSSSDVAVNDRVTLFNGVEIANSVTSKRRPLQGQSDRVFNMGLNYITRGGLNITLAYNTFSKRLNSLGTGTLTDVYEYPFNSLNMSSTKKVGRIRISLKATNLLDARVKYGQIEQSTGKLKLTDYFRPGRSFSFGIRYAK
jgi:outer membrane receptor protein involved in Fe transport